MVTHCRDCLCSINTLLTLTKQITTTTENTWKYTVFNLITVHTPICAQSSNFVVFRLHQNTYIYFFEGICCGYPFELHQLVDAIQMNTITYLFIKKFRKNIHKKTTTDKQHLVSPLLIVIRCTLSIGRYIFYRKFSEYF